MSDADWSPDDYDPPPIRSREELERDDKWQTLNNQLFHIWRAWPAALDRYDEYRFAKDGRRMSAEHRAHVTQRYRERLRAEHGTAEVDPRWEAMRSERLRKRGIE